MGIILFLMIRSIILAYILVIIRCHDASTRMNSIYSCKVMLSLKWKGCSEDKKVTQAFIITNGIVDKVSS